MYNVSNPQGRPTIATRDHAAGSPIATPASSPAFLSLEAIFLIFSFRPLRKDGEPEEAFGLFAGGAAASTSFSRRGLLPPTGAPAAGALPLPLPFASASFSAAILRRSAGPGFLLFFFSSPPGASPPPPPRTFLADDEAFFAPPPPPPPPRRRRSACP